MTPTTAFIVAAALLVLLTLGILLAPLLRAPKASLAIDRREANLDIFRDQLAELERDRSEGSLGEADFAQAKSELQRRLLEETQSETLAPVFSRGRKTALTLLLALPLLAFGLYGLLGKPIALDPIHTQARMSPEQIEGMLGKLVDKLKANPGDTKGWVTLARSYKALGRYAEAAEAYSHGGALLDEEPMLLADYAEVLIQVNGGQFGGQPAKLIARALKIDPDEPLALFLAGSAASDRNDLAGVIDYWGRLLPQLQPGSQDANVIGEAVAAAREALGKTGAKNGKKAAERRETLSGDIVLSGKLAAQTKPDDLLFLFARTEEGSRMPLAVLRLSVGELPFSFRLDDSMALPGGQKISDFKTVSIEARIAKAGKAQTSSGDLFGTLKSVKPGSKNLKLVIDQVQP